MLLYCYVIWKFYYHLFLTLESVADMLGEIAGALVCSDNCQLRQAM